MTVNVDENTTSFDLKAKQSVAPEKSVYRLIDIDTDLTTAVRGRHYKLLQEMTYHFPAGSTEEQAITITLIPENITSELTLVFRDPPLIGVEPDESLIKTVTVRLLPVQ